jgi:hypothetical protein
MHAHPYLRRGRLVYNIGYRDSAGSVMHPRPLALRMAPLVASVLVSGCSLTATGKDKAVSNATPAPAKTAAAVSVANECKPNPGKCMYNGSYEPGERQFAEDEAKKLNAAETARLKKAFGN